ncbi:MAG: hypothetical protein ACI9WS_003512, partial [Paraglaciecola psychrophila]
YSHTRFVCKQRSGELIRCTLCAIALCAIDEVLRWLTRAHTDSQIGITAGFTRQ